MRYIKFLLFILFPVIFLMYFVLEDFFTNRKFADIVKDEFGCG